MKNRLQFNRHYAISQSREDALTALRARITDPDFVPLIGEPMVFRYRDENDNIQVMLVIGKKAGRSMSEREYHIIDTADLDEKIAAEVAAREALDAETIKKVIFDGVESEFADNIATLSVSANSIPIGPYEEYVGPVDGPHEIHDYYTVLDAVKQVDVNFDDLTDKTNKKVDGLHLVKVTTGLDTNVKEAYDLVNLSGLPQENSARILIYKDSSLFRAYLGHVDDRLEAIDNPTVVPGTGDTAICFIYLRTDGFYDLVAVNVEEFLEENEFKDGLRVDNHKVYVKIDGTSEGFLTVSANGVKLTGIQNAINTAKSEEEERAEGVEGAIQGELDRTQTGAGLASNGSYVHDHQTSYIGNATSLANADHILDVALKEASDYAIESSGALATRINLEETRAQDAEGILSQLVSDEVARALAAETFISAITTNIISGAGLSFGSEEGMYPKNHHSGATVIGPAKSLDQADILLDFAVGGLSGGLFTLSSATESFGEDISNLSGAVITLTAKTNEIENDVLTLSGVAEYLTNEISGGTHNYKFYGDKDGAIKVNTEPYIDPQTREEYVKVTTEPTMASNNIPDWDNINSSALTGSNGLVTAYQVKQYVKDGLDGDATYVGDMPLPIPGPGQENPLVGKIHFDITKPYYDTTHEALYRTDNNFGRLANTIGLSGDGYNAFFYPSAATEGCLIISTGSGVTNVMSGMIAIDRFIDALDWTGTTNTNQIFTGITEKNGKVSASTANVTTRTLNGYGATADTKVAANQTLGVALGNLQGQINAMDKTASSVTGKFVRTVAENDGKVSETLGYILDTDIKITAATPTAANVKEAWKLVNNAGTQLGSTINIYKDSSVVEIYLGTSADTVNTTTGVITKLGGDKESLNYVYHKEDGTYEMVKIDLEQFLIEPEFKDGLTVDGHLVKVKIDPASEEYLTVGTNGVKLTGIDALSASVVTNKNNISSLSASVVTNKSNISSLSASVVTNKNSISSLSASVVTNKNSISSLSAGTIQLSADTKNVIAALSAGTIQLSANTKSAIAALSASVVTNKSNISSLSAGTIQLSANTKNVIAALSASVVTNKNSISSLSASVVTNKSNISSLSASVVTNKNSISSLSAGTIQLSANTKNTIAALSAGTIQLSADTSAAITEAVAAAVLDSVSVAADGNSTKVTVKVGDVTKFGSAVVPYATSAGNADTVDSKHIWTGTASQLPSPKDPNTIYILI